VTVGQSGVVLQHGDLEFEEFPEKRHFRRLSRFFLRSVNIRHV
jgi:hypothetical protein